MTFIWSDSRPISLPAKWVLLRLDKSRFTWKSCVPKHGEGEKGRESLCVEVPKQGDGSRVAWKSCAFKQGRRWKLRIKSGRGEGDNTKQDFTWVYNFHYSKNDFVLNVFVNIFLINGDRRLKPIGGYSGSWPWQHMLRSSARFNYREPFRDNYQYFILIFL